MFVTSVIASAERRWLGWTMGQLSTVNSYSLATRKFNQTVPAHLEKRFCSGVNAIPESLVCSGAQRIQ
jgi:hypothetical protein